MRFAVIVGVALFSVSSVHAELINVTYQGTILAAEDSTGQGRLDGKISVGTPWTAAFTIDSNAPDLYAGTSAEGIRARYPSASNLVVTIGSQATISGPVSVHVHNEQAFGDQDTWAVRGEPGTFSGSLVAMTLADNTVYAKVQHGLNLFGPDDAIASNALTVPNVADGIWWGWYVTLAQTSDGLYVLGNVETVNGNVWQHPVPEPACWVIILLGAVCLMGRRL